MQLSQHFSLAEFTKSTAAQNLVPPDANEPTPKHLANLRDTAAGMEEVRKACGDRPIIVMSGYRNARVNKAVGGVASSAHALGLACDFTVIGLSLLEAARAIHDADIKFDQLIHEASRHVLHISFDPRARAQLLTQASGAGTPVTKGITWSV